MKSNQKQLTTVSRDVAVKEIQQQMAARLGIIEDEFTRGFDMINTYQSTVTVFGSARLTEESEYYQKARELGNRLALNGFAVITGGGRGIMEAANRGAFEAGGDSIGVNIALPHEQQLNSYLTDSMEFQHFYARKVMLVFSAAALVSFPGGFGTLDEMFEVLTLVQTHKTPKIPIILVGTSFWKPLDTFIKSQLRDSLATITPGDEDLYHITDDLDDVVARIELHRESTSVFASNPHRKAVASE